MEERGVSHSRRPIVSQARCGGALSCWKIKDSPHISRTTGSVTGDNPLETIPPEITLLPKIPPEVPRPPTRVH